MTLVECNDISCIHNINRTCTNPTILLDSEGCCDSKEQE